MAMHRLSASIVRRKLIVLPIYIGLLAGADLDRAGRSTGVHPADGSRLCDRGCAASVWRIAVAHGRGDPSRVRDRAADAGAAHTAAFTGLSAATFTNATNAAAVFVTFKPFQERLAQGLTGVQDRRRAVRAPASDRGSFHHSHPAAAGARAGQFRRLQDADSGASRPRRQANSRSHIRTDGKGARKSEARRGVHDLLGQFAPSVHRDRPPEGGGAKCADHQHLRYIAAESRTPM